MKTSPWLLTLFLLVPGCATTIHPPRHLSDPVPIFVTNYGLHSSLLLPLEHGGYAEYAWGNYKWFALNQTTAPQAVEAMLFSKESTLARRELPISPTDSPEHVAHLIGVPSAVRFEVSRARADAVRMTLEARFARNSRPVVYNELTFLNHIPDPEQYWLFHQCNHWVGRWLERMGCRLDGPRFWASYRVAPVR